MMKLRDALGKVIHNVWGYEAPDCKQRRSCGDGEVRALFWSPSKDDMAMCDALMDLGDGVEPVFVMEVQSIESVLAPRA